MIKVIGQDPNFVYQVTCHNCASVLEYTQEDTTTEVLSDYLGAGHKSTFLMCPTCSSKIKLINR